MATMVRSYAIQGIDGYPVDIEVKLFEGQPMISVIGMGDQAVKEAADRIQSAIDETGYVYPKKKIVISLAPGDRKKRGSHFDLAMAVGLLQESEEIGAKELSRYGFIGELSLDGTLRGCEGILPMVIAAKDCGLENLIVPSINIREAKAVGNVNIIGCSSLKEVIGVLEGKHIFSGPEEEIQDEIRLEDVDFSDIRGQKDLVEAVVLAAAGGHNMLMIGEPGCGKTMIASRIPSILPTMTEKEQLEVTKIHSISGHLKKGHGLLRQRPFRAPHHNASLNALIGGGMNALPGEVSLAHNGVLFLDEIAEFTRRTLDALRQPIEDKKVSIARVNGSNTYPSNFMLVAAMNPCPCGYYPSGKCRCSDYEIIKYRGKISGPILDRIDIQKEVHPVEFFELDNSEPAPSSENLRRKIEQARQIQQNRYREEENIYCNAQMTTSLIQRYCKMDDESMALLKNASDTYHYSARVIHKLLRMARTNADLRNEENISEEDIRKVLTLRDLDQSNSQLIIVN